MLSNTAYYWNGMLECNDDCENDCGECHEEISKSFEEVMGRKPEITDVFQLDFYVNLKKEVKPTDTHNPQAEASDTTPSNNHHQVRTGSPKSATQTSDDLSVMSNKSPGGGVSHEGE